MGKIVISANCSLDGVVQDPDGKDGMAFGGWFDRSVGEDRAPWTENLVAEAMGAEALLLGRRSDEWFASRWLARTGAYADRLNTLPKYVVSRSIEHAAWSNATVLSGDLADEIDKLKRDVSGEIVVYASFQLVRALIARGLFDELRVAVLPVVVGQGERLFGRADGTRVLRHTQTRALGSGIVFSTYEMPEKES